MKVHDWFYTRQDSEFIWSAYCVKIPGLIVVSKWSWFFYSWFCAKLHSTSLQTKYIYNCNWPIELLKQFLPLFCCILCCGVQLQSHPKNLTVTNSFSLFDDDETTQTFLSLSNVDNQPGHHTVMVSCNHEIVKLKNIGTPFFLIFYSLNPLFCQTYSQLCST